MLYNEPQSCVEMLSNANRYPIEYADLYEPTVVFALVVKDDTDLKYANVIFDVSKTSKTYPTDDSSSSVKIKEFSESKIHV